MSEEERMQRRRKDNYNEVTSGPTGGLQISNTSSVLQSRDSSGCQT